MYCSVLQCVAVCCSVLQYVALCCSVSRWVAVCCIALHCVALCCTVLHCVVWCLCVAAPDFESSHPQGLQFYQARLLCMFSLWCRTCESVMSNISMSHGTHFNESCHTRVWHMNELVLSSSTDLYVLMPVNACYTYECSMPHMSIRRCHPVLCEYVNASRSTYEYDIICVVKVLT